MGHVNDGGNDILNGFRSAWYLGIGLSAFLASKLGEIPRRIEDKSLELFELNISVNFGILDIEVVQSPGCWGCSN